MEQPQPAQPARAAAVDDAGSTAKIVYVLYLVSVIPRLALVTAVIGVVVAYISRAHAPDWLRTHYRQQIRTFWIWIVYCAAGFIINFVLPHRLFLWPSAVLLLTVLIIGIWLAVRCVKGLRALAVRQPYSNPESWYW